MKRFFCFLLLLGLLLAGCSPAPVPAPTAVPTATAAPAASEGALEVLFVNVGRADAMLLRLGETAVLIDAGEDVSAPRLIGALRVMGVERLDAVFLTHTHSDHIGGLAPLASRIPVGRVYAARISENKKNGENKITALAADLSLPLERLDAGKPVTVGALTFDVLGPLTFNVDDDNDNSLVLRLAVNGRTLLFMGDAQFAEEADLIDANLDLACDVLKVGNHGNPDATGTAFAARAQPEYAFFTTDTAADGDSANPRVLAALGAKQAFLTQDFQVGALLTVAPDGAMAVTDPARAAFPADVRLTADVTNQTVTLQNAGKTDLDLAGCMLLSERGGQFYAFPTGAALPAGQSCTLVAEGRTGDYVWTGEDKPLHQKKEDPLALYDPCGGVIARTDG